MNPPRSILTTIGRKSGEPRESPLVFLREGDRVVFVASADVSKAAQAREVIAFCNHWKTASGTDPAMLIMDQKLTTHAVLGELDDRGVTFLTLRMRSGALMKHIDTLTGTDFKTITLDRPGRHNRPKVQARMFG